MERNTTIPDNENRSKREGGTEKYKRMGKMNPETFYYLQEKHVSRENSSVKVNGTVITNPEDIVWTVQEWYGATAQHNFTLQMKGR
jgi:hypothetical protein